LIVVYKKIAIAIRARKERKKKREEEREEERKEKKRTFFTLPLLFSIFSLFYFSRD
jgi:hypothetical protein